MKFTSTLLVMFVLLMGSTANSAVRDKIAPVVGSFSLPANASSLTVPVLSLTASDNIAVTGFYIATSSVKPSAKAAGWTAAPPSSYVFSSSGAKILYAFAKDKAGNVSNARSASVNIVLASPTPTPTVTPTPTPTVTPTPTPTVTPTPTPTVTPTPTPTATVATQNLGFTSIGSSVDSSDSNYINASRFVMGAQGGAAVSMSVYIANPVSVSPNNKFQVGIFADNNGVPGALVAASAAQAIAGDNWNVTPINAQLQANATYWLGYNTNGTSSTNNNVAYSSGSVGQTYWMSSTFGSFPSAFSSSSGSSSATQMSIFVSFIPSGVVTPPAAGSASLSWTPPITNTDGSQLLDLSSYRISYGTSSGAYTSSADVTNASAVSHIISNLPTGKTYFFAIQAINSSGVASEYSLEDSKFIP